jgi:hypothetical protein
MTKAIFQKLLQYIKKNISINNSHRYTSETIVDIATKKDIIAE